MSGQHTKPTLAFIALAVLTAAMIGSQYRADAGGETFVAGVHVPAQTSAKHHAEPTGQPAASGRSDAPGRATRTSRGGTQRLALPPVAPVEYDSGELAGTHVVSNLKSKSQKGSHPPDRGRHRHGEPALKPAG